ncbi:hypothetical protein F3J23_20705 [Chryseobacterium sp. Tr-659]|nr:hypothetical protein [Chryseobacterium sp. Tr-659]
MPDLGRWNGMDQLSEEYHAASPYAYVMNNPASLVDPDGRWISDSGNIVDTSGSSYGFLGSSTKSQGATNYRGLENFQAKRSYLSNEGGGEDKPGFFKKTVNFIKNLFGWNRTKVDVGPAEKISEEQFSKEISTWQIVSALLFNSTDPYSAIGNMGVGPYAEERENIGMAAMIFINPEAAAEGLERKTLNAAANNLVKIGVVEGDVMIFSSKIKEEIVEGITDFAVKDGKLYLNQLHLQGSSGGKVGREALWNIAKDLGKQHNVTEVIIQGGKRTTGKYIGQVPSPITIKVD